MSIKAMNEMSVWPSLTIEGNLIAPAKIEQISQTRDDADVLKSYGIRKGLTFRDEISTAFRVGQSHFNSFTKLTNPSVDATRRFTYGVLEEVFGFDDLKPSDGVASLVAGGRVPVVIVPPSEDNLDRRSRTLSTDRPRSPAVGLQDHLNDSESALWGLVTNATLIRLMRDNASLTRPAHIEANLKQIFTDNDIASFAVLWRLIHRSRFGDEDAAVTDCHLEEWREKGAQEGVKVRDRLADQVRRALRILGSGFLYANPELADRLNRNEVALTDWFNELLRLVYRLIFLMVAEDRHLLHPDTAKPEERELYAKGYSLAMLRLQCRRGASWNRHRDRYEGMKIVFRALSGGQKRLGLPALGGLFAKGKMPHLENARLGNKAFMEALYHISWLRDKVGIAPINWRSMETEELGSVYESLLELQPQLEDDGKSLTFASKNAEQRGSQRKTTGSYYTPDSLVQTVLDSALDPVLDKTEGEADDPEKALVELSIVDPACGSGHFLLAAARRIATRLARIRAGNTPSAGDFRHALRDVTRCCIHGVDNNPMAVELTKVALWIETVDPGLPLGFFDAQIRCGNALLGVLDLEVLREGIPDAAYKSLTGDDKGIANYYSRANRAAKAGQKGFDFAASHESINATKPLALDFSAFRDLPEDNPEQIHAKERRFQKLRRRKVAVRARTAADLYIAAFLMRKIGLMPTGASDRKIPTTEELWAALNQDRINQNMLDACEVARRTYAFHWPLEFPDIMQRGGFNVVVGNPPWERISLHDREFFSSRDPEIADAPNKAARDRQIRALAYARSDSQKNKLFNTYIEAKHKAEALSEFVRISAADSGRFALTGRGDVNTYALFAELITDLTRSRAGFIVPTGIATDASTSLFFASLVAKKRLARLVDFENRAPIFSDVHRSYKFCILSLGENVESAHFTYLLTDLKQLAEAERNFILSNEVIKKLNPNTHTAPVFRSRADAELTSKIYKRVPILIEESKGISGNPWGLSFVRLFDMANDSHLFRTVAQLDDEGFSRRGVGWVKSQATIHGRLALSGGRMESELNLVGGGPRPIKCYVPLYEAKMIHQYDHRWASFSENGKDCTVVEEQRKFETDSEPTPRYWVPETEVTGRLEAKSWNRDWLMGWRDVTGAHVLRTTIATVLPKAGVGHSLPLFFLTSNPNRWAGFLANLNSLTFDFIARQKVGGTHLTYTYFKQLPALPPDFYNESRLAFVVPKVLKLTYTSKSLAFFALDLGHNGPPFPWDESLRAPVRADLDAFYARAYGLTRDELLYILDPSNVKGNDYPSETFRVLKESEVRKFGEYRTQRLVLAAWDRMEANGEFAAMGL